MVPHAAHIYQPLFAVFRTHLFQQKRLDSRFEFAVTHHLHLNAQFLQGILVKGNFPPQAPEIQPPPGIQNDLVSHAGQVIGFLFVQVTVSIDRLGTGIPESNQGIPDLLNRRHPRVHHRNVKENPLDPVVVPGLFNGLNDFVKTQFFCHA